MSETMDLLREDLAAVAELHNPPRDGVLQLVLEIHAERYGANPPLDLAYLNSLLVGSGQPITTETEIDVLYSRKVPPSQRN